VTRINSVIKLIKDHCARVNARTLQITIHCFLRAECRENPIIRNAFVIKVFTTSVINILYLHTLAYLVLLCSHLGNNTRQFLADVSLTHAGTRWCCQRTVLTLAVTGISRCRENAKGAIMQKISSIVSQCPLALYNNASERETAREESRGSTERTKSLLEDK